jgi:hypothetical protein
LAISREIAYFHTGCGPILARKPDLEETLWPMNTLSRARRRFYLLIKSSQLASRAGWADDIDL